MDPVSTDVGTFVVLSEKPPPGMPIEHKRPIGLCGPYGDSEQPVFQAIRDIVSRAAASDGQDYLERAATDLKVASAACFPTHLSAGDKVEKRFRAHDVVSTTPYHIDLVAKMCQQFEEFDYSEGRCGVCCSAGIEDLKPTIKCPGCSYGLCSVCYSKIENVSGELMPHAPVACPNCRLPVRISNSKGYIQYHECFIGGTDHKSFADTLVKNLVQENDRPRMSLDENASLMRASQLYWDYVQAQNPDPIDIPDLSDVSTYIPSILPPDTSAGYYLGVDPPNPVKDDVYDPSVLLLLKHLSAVRATTCYEDAMQHARAGITDVHKAVGKLEVVVPDSAPGEDAVPNVKTRPSIVTGKQIGRAHV